MARTIARRRVWLLLAPLVSTALLVGPVAAREPGDDEPPRPHHRTKPLLSSSPAGWRPWVPEHYFAECLAVLRRDEINGRHPPARIASAVERIVEGPLRRVSLKPLLREAWRLRGNLTVADALYVVVAQHLDCKLNL